LNRGRNVTPQEQLITMNAFPRISLGFCALVALLASSSESRADTTNRAKGIAGGSLLGAEVVMLTEAVIGVKPTWLYVVGGIAGAGGGGVAGYYLGGSSSPKPPSFVLAGGIALFIPTLIGIVTATQFQPDDSYHQSSPDEEDDASEARLELPQVEVAQSFTAEEAHVHQLRQVPAVHLSFLRGVF
jgi:hypothetical protein